jgi:hypothetical protein
MTPPAGAASCVFCADRHCGSLQKANPVSVTKGRPKPQYPRCLTGARGGQMSRREIGSSLDMISADEAASSLRCTAL